MPFEIDAPCKLNLCLAVGGRRTDGFHDIESIFAAFSLCDTLKFEAARGDESGLADDEVRMEAEELPPVFSGAFSLRKLPPEKNLVWRAIKLFKHETGFNSAVKAKVRKRIPPGGGLGGGSSDAAAALAAMNALSGAGLSVRALEGLGAALGGDVPFFVRVVSAFSAGKSGEPLQAAAFVSGKGERVEPAVCPPLDAVIVNPGFESGTAEAFALLDAERAAVSAETAAPRLSKMDLFAALPKNPAEWPFYNDFLPVFLKVPPYNKCYSAILRELADSGAVFSGLSGSGASCFGIFADSGRAQTAASRLSERWTFARTASVLSKPPDDSDF
jgi:4-diphosphocytidyl-2-C-methyl-D-erythritol kinase